MKAKVQVCRITVKPVKNGNSQKVRKFVFNTNYRLMQVKNIADSAILATILSFVYF